MLSCIACCGPPGTLMKTLRRQGCAASSAAARATLHATARQRLGSAPAFSAPSTATTLATAPTACAGGASGQATWRATARTATASRAAGRRRARPCACAAAARAAPALERRTTSGECTRELPQVMRGERLGAARQAAQQPVYGMGGPGGGAGCYSSGGGWGASRGGGGYQHGHRGPHSRYASYSAYAEIEQPGRRYDDSFDYDRGYGGGYKRQRR